MADKSKPKYGYNFARTHKETDFDIMTLAVDLKKKVAKYVLNEKYVPKKWRYFDGRDAVIYARNIRDCASWANDIKIGTEDADPEKVKERLEYEEKALRYCNMLQFQLMDIIDDCDGANEDNMSEITDDLDALMGKLKKWNEKDKERSRTDT